MTISEKTFIMLTVLALTGSFSSNVIAAPNKAKKIKPPVTAEEIANIEKALPKKAIAKPARPRRILVFNRTEGYYHTAIQCGAKALELMGKKTGAFEVVVSEDMSAFTAKNLKQFDAVCFNSTTNLTFEDQSHRKALMNFVKGGKGIIGIHGATDCFKTWPEAAEMICGTFDSHPWTKNGTWAFKVDELSHKLTKPFNPEGFKLADEIYRHKPLGLRERCRVLVSLDMSDDNTRNAKGVLPTDNDIPVSWVRPFGKGRVFYTGFGHNHNIFWNEPILAHILAGVQYAIGDLEIDDAVPQPNTLTDAEKKAGWKLLFDGKTAENFNTDSDKIKCKIADGAMTIRPGDKKTGNINFAGTYRNFDLKLDFKLTKGANSGIIYLIGKNAKDAFEYQIIDDEKYKNSNRSIGDNRLLASLYDMIPAKNKMTNPIGQWNQARIVVNGKHIEHWLNGIKVLQFDRGSEEFKTHLAASKYKNSKDYGKIEKGGILLQGYGNEVSYRNIKIRELK